VRKDGTDRWVEAVPRGLYDEAGELVGGVIGVRDIDDEVTAREALEHELEFDDLTGLAKRSVALDRIQEILDTRRTDGWALLCAGIDGMTAVNQAYTYAAGDEVLRAVADRLVHATGAADRVARIAGDEFVILMRDIVTPTDAANAAERILAAVRGPVEVDGTTIDVTACVGIATPSGRDAEALLRDAAAAMRQAARKGSDTWEFLDGNVAADTRQVLAVQASLRDALQDGRIQPWLMPVASLADGSVRAYEALVRWVHADGSVTTPDAFLDVAERSGLILKIDHAILVQVLDALQTLPPDVPVAVNVSAATLSSGTFCEEVMRQLERTGQDPSRLHLEVTETALFAVTEAVQETMRALADIGVAWWVDDFGTGFSSISHLRDLPISGLKLDQTFTKGITSDDSHASRLSQGLAGLAEGLGLQTIAEGVETILQARILAEHGWQMGQGWFYGRPVPLTTRGSAAEPA
jgi:diguanylate cyclase (GGDEF)-like protein